MLREQLHQQALDALDTLAGAYERQGDPRRCAGTPAASLCSSPGASRPTASSCAAWRSRATAARRWRSTRLPARAGGRARHRSGPATTALAEQIRAGEGFEAERR